MKRKTFVSVFEIIFLVGATIALFFAISSVPHLTSQVGAHTSSSTYPEPVLDTSANRASSYPVPPVPTTVETKAPTLTPTPTPKTDANGWYIYQDTKAGYSISYPKGVQLIAYDKGYVYLWFSVLGLNGHFGMEIECRNNPDEKTAIELAKQIYENTSLKVAPENFQVFINAQDILIGENSATKVKIPSIVSDYTIFIPKGGKILIINLEHDAVISSAPSEVIKLANQILDTLKFSE